MAFAMTPSQSRTLAVSLLILAVVSVLGIFFVPAYLLHRHYDRYLEENSDKLARYERVAATRAALEAKLAAVKARDPRSGFLKNSGPSLAASEVQDVAKNLIEGNGGRLSALQISEHKDDGRFRQVGVNVQIAASVPAFRKILYAIESAKPYLFTDKLVVRSNVHAAYRAVPGPEPEILFITMDVSGFALVGP